MARLRLVLVAPRIPMNVGSCLRTAAALRAELVLVGPLGFVLSHKALRRSSVGYSDELKPIVYRDAHHFWAEISGSPETEWYLATKKGTCIYGDITYGQDVVVLFGNEEMGMDPDFLVAKEQRDAKALASGEAAWSPIVECRIPMADTRCLNLAVSVGVFGYEVARQWKWSDLNREHLQSCGIFSGSLP